MKGIRRWRNIRHHVPPLMAVGLLLLAALLTTFLLFWISPLDMDVLSSLIVWSKALVLVVNWLPIWGAMTLVYFISSNLIAAIATVDFVVIAMAVINRAKLTLRGDPLLHWDIAMVGEVLGVSKGFGWQTIALALAAVFFYIILAILLCRLLKTEKLSAKVRMAGAGVTALLLVLCNATLLSSSAIEQSLPVWGNLYNQADVHNSKGNLYFFLYTWNNSHATVPDGYNEQETKALLSSFDSAAADDLPTAAPNILVIMGEAFSDISNGSVFDFEGFENPLKNYNALAEEGIAGHIVVPWRGGGTADTEYDVLTARSSRLMRNAPYAYRTLVSSIDAMPALLRQAGYTTFALHPGYSWFYNRQNVYPLLGFESAAFEDSFPKDAYMDMFISEEATFDRLLSMLEAHESSDSEPPLFGFCLTIQNHAAYQDRYLPSGTINFTAGVSLTAEEQNILSNYFAGTADADRELGRLTAYLNTLSSPYVLLYYGDHLPALDLSLYNLIVDGTDAPEGSLEGETRLHQTPFLIWQNDAARARNVFGGREETAVMPENMTISSSFLGAYLMELTGFDRLSPFWQFAGSVRADWPVVLEAQAFDIEGNPWTEDAEKADTLRQYRHCIHMKNTEN